MIGRIGASTDNMQKLGLRLDRSSQNSRHFRGRPDASIRLIPRPFPMTRITAAALSVDLRQTYFEWGQGRRGLIDGRERFDLELDAMMGRVRLGFTAPALSFRVSVFALFFVFVFMFFAAG